MPSAMALRSPSSTSRRDLSPRDSSPADSPPPTSQGGSGNEARYDVTGKMKEVQHMLANLENEGVKIDGKIASIIDDEVARIKAEAEREKNIKVLKRRVATVMLAISSTAFGFLLRVDWCEQALYADVIKRILFGEKYWE